MENEPNFEGEKMKMPTANSTSALPESTETKTRGLFIALLAAALAVILAGFYFWYQAIPTVTETPDPATRPTAEMNKEPETTTAVAQTESFSAMSTSDELNAIEADLESTNLDSLEAELLQIDTELEASLQP